MQKRSIEFPFVQTRSGDCGCICLANLIHYHGNTACLERIRQLSGVSDKGASLLGLVRAAKGFNVDLVGLRCTADYLLENFSTPLILLLASNHYVLFFPDSGGLSFLDPCYPFLMPCTDKWLRTHWADTDGYGLLLAQEL